MDEMTQATDGESLTIDALLKSHVVHRPTAIALADAPDRSLWTSGSPRRLTYGELDRCVEAMASRLRSLGLPHQSVVAYQLPNCVEHVVTLLGVMRAGLVAAPLPLLWRQSDIGLALARVAAKALIAIGRIGTHNATDVMMHAAAEAFSVRFVGAFGEPLDDGIVPLDDIFTEDAPAPDEPPGWSADQISLVTFDVTGEGIIALPRTHAQAIGTAQLVASATETGGDFLTTMSLGSLAGLSASVFPWLISGGQLTLHHAFSPEALREQFAREPAGTVAVPGPIMKRLAESGLLDNLSARTLLGVWRTPERLVPGGVVAIAGVKIVDLLSFGEIGLFALPRGAEGSPEAIPAGHVGPAGAGRSVFVMTGRCENGTLGLGGPLVSAEPYRAASRRADNAAPAATSRDLVDTGYPCRLDKLTNRFLIDGPPAGMISVGGYRFVARELNELMARFENGAAVAALPDVISGHRLAGVGADRPVLREALLALGANPLIAASFRERKGARTTAA